MSFNIVNDLTNFKSDSAQVELNSQINQKVREKTGKKNENIEIFSKIINGKDTSKYGKKVDTFLDNMKMVATAAVGGDSKAKAEINSLVTVTLQQPLIQRLSIANVFGNSKTVGFMDELRYEYYQIQASELSRIQASSGAVTFPVTKKRTGIAETQTASAGLAIDYRELASGATDGLAIAGEQVIADMMNQVILSHINALRNGIKNTTTLKNYAAGITQTTVEKVHKKAKRFGNVAITGDISAVETLSQFTGFNINSATPTEVRFPPAVMEEVAKTGLLSSFKKSAVVEIPNAFNLTKFNTDGDFYDTYLPTTDLWFIPQGVLTPLQMVNRGGLTSQTGSNLNDRTEITRWDLEFGNYVVDEYIPFLGYIFDENLDE